MVSYILQVSEWVGYTFPGGFRDVKLDGLGHNLVESLSTGDGNFFQELRAEMLLITQGNNKERAEQERLR